MKIRLAEAKDIDMLESVRVKAIKGDCHQVYDELKVKALIGRQINKETYEKAVERSRIMVLTEKGEIGGFILFRVPSKSSSHAHIDGVYVISDLAKKGFGKQLVDKVETLAKEGGNAQVKLITTKNAEPFFRKLGYDNSGPALRQTIDGQVINLQPLFKTVILPGSD